MENKFGTLFTFKKINKNDEIIQTVGPFHNVVLESALDAMGTQPLGEMIIYLKIGSSDTPALSSDTNLISQVATKTSTTYETYGGNYTPLYTFAKKGFKWNIGEITAGAPVNINEVALYGPLISAFNRQVLPATITIASDEGLIVETETRMYPDINYEIGERGTFIFNGEEKWYTRCIAMSTWLDTSSFYNWLGRQINSPIGKHRAKVNSSLQGIDGTRSSSVSWPTYVSGSYEHFSTYTWNPGTYTGDIQRIATACYYDTSTFYPLYYYSFDDPITVTDLEQFTFTTKYSWSPYVEGYIPAFDPEDINLPLIWERNFGFDNNNYEGLTVVGSPGLSADYVSFDGISDGLHGPENEESSMQEVYVLKFSVEDKNKGTNQVIFTNISTSDTGITFGIDSSGGLGVFTRSDWYKTIPSTEYNNAEIYYLVLSTNTRSMRLYKDSDKSLVYQISWNTGTQPSFSNSTSAEYSFGYAWQTSNQLGTPSYFTGDIYYLKIYNGV